MELTIKKLAELAGVSPATVSMALSGNPRVAAATRARIQALADEVGYVPSNLGRALQSRRSRMVGYLLSSVATSFFNEIVQGVGHVATANGYGLLLGITEGAAPGEAEQLRLFREKRVDGLIVSSSHPDTRPVLSQCERTGLPVIVCSSTPFDPAIPNVLTDNEAGGRMAAEHLIGLGHTRLAFFCASGSGPARYAGFAAAAADAGIGPVLKASSEAELAELLRLDTPPTAVFAYADAHAFKAKHVAESLGLRIPQDLSLVGFDDIWVSSLPEFDLTTIAQPRREIGEATMAMLLQRIEGNSVEPLLLEPTLVVRGSTAPPAV